MTVVDLIPPARQARIDQHAEEILELALRINPLVDQLIKKCGDAETELHLTLVEKQHAIHMKMELAEMLRRYEAESSKA